MFFEIWGLFGKKLGIIIHCHLDKPQPVSNEIWGAALVKK
jgi:hypothetical protein